ncbi:DUF29 family protein [Methylobacterium sp. PvR107]|uniref:DUF29 family protein n=1 Tax=Methylobacterium sp. PvR107 TaxID=2806597 RepID=UPI001B4F074A|nr:DUF29 family protein [Methylobacterium sp. PvR107]MBP1179199.1 hypothetical protein [Methylobacterium sp. PvR107]
MTALKTRPAPAGTAYADDFYTGTQEQSARLRSGELSGLDRENPAEEIASSGKSQFASRVRALRNVLPPMLKCRARNGSGRQALPRNLSRHLSGHHRSLVRD